MSQSQASPRGEQPEVPTFDVRALEILVALQSALTKLVSGAGVAASAPAEMSRALGVDLKLAWKIDRLLDLRAPEAALAYVPGSRALLGFTKAARSAGASAAMAEAVMEAHAGFESFAHIEAGSRKEFDSLLASIRQEHDSTDAVNLRKAATEAQASLLGLRADVQFGLIAIRPSPDGSAIDLLNVRGFQGLTCLRRNVVWRVGSSFIYRYHEGNLDDQGKQPLDVLDPASGAPILRGWTSDPIPELETVIRPEGIAEYVLKRSEIGASRTVDLALGEFFPAADKLNREGDEPDQMRAIQQLRTPARRVITDVFVETGFFESDLPAARVYSSIFTGVHSQFGLADLLPIPVDLVQDGGGRKDRWFDELCDDVLARVNWKRSDLTRFRFELPYPPCPASIWMEWSTK